MMPAYIERQQELCPPAKLVTLSLSAEPGIRRAPDATNPSRPSKASWPTSTLASAIRYLIRPKRRVLQAAADWLAMLLQGHRDVRSQLRRRRVGHHRRRRPISDRSCGARIAYRSGRRTGHRLRPSQPIATAAAGSAGSHGQKQYHNRHALHCLRLLTGNILRINYGGQRQPVRRQRCSRALLESGQTTIPGAQ